MIELKAREGYYLTQNKEVSDEERVFITAIKGMSLNELDWREATQFEKDEFEKMQEEKLQN